MRRSNAVVPFYRYVNVEHDYSDQDCQVKCRVTSHDVLSRFGPSFVVRFEDGWLEAVPGILLHPSFVLLGARPAVA